MRSSRGPDSTGWVQYATTFSAPWLFQGRSGLAQVFGSIDQIVHQHASAAPDVTDDVHHLGNVGLGRRLSMIARSTSRRLASARARTTPPTRAIPRSGFHNAVSRHRRAESVRRRRCPPECRKKPGSGRHAGPWSAGDPRRAGDMFATTLAVIATRAEPSAIWRA